MPFKTLPAPPPAPVYMDVSELFWEEIIPPCISSGVGAACSITKTEYSIYPFYFGPIAGTCTLGMFNGVATKGCLPNAAYPASSFVSARSTRASTHYCTTRCDAVGLVSGGRPTPYEFSFDYEQFIKTGLVP